jgi:peroxiredoxin
VDIDPERACVSIEPDASWTFRGRSAISLCFSISPDSVYYDADSAPNVGVSINGDWEHCDALRAVLKTHGRPPDFVSTARFIIDGSGTIRDAKADPDYRYRPEPSEVLDIVKKFGGSEAG